LRFRDHRRLERLDRLHQVVELIGIVGRRQRRLVGGHGLHRGALVRARLLGLGLILDLHRLELLLRRLR
jgi:hypothetical protein